MLNLEKSIIFTTNNGICILGNYGFCYYCIGILISRGLHILGELCKHSRDLLNLKWEMIFLVPKLNMERFLGVLKLFAIFTWVKMRKAAGFLVSEPGLISKRIKRNHFNLIKISHHPVLGLFFFRLIIIKSRF